MEEFYLRSDGSTLLIVQRKGKSRRGLLKINRESLCAIGEYGLWEGGSPSRGGNGVTYFMFNILKTKKVHVSGHTRVSGVRNKVTRDGRKTREIGRGMYVGSCRVATLCKRHSEYVTRGALGKVEIVGIISHLMGLFTCL